MFGPTITFWLAAGVLVALGTAPLILLARDVRRSRFTVVQYFFYGFGRLMARILWRAEIEGKLPVDERQGAVIVSNHRGPFDPAIIQLATDRVVHWMVAREYCSHPLLAWFFGIPECIPASRSGIDTAATKAAIRYVQAGELVGMLPEGRINRTRDVLLPGRPGAALVALRAGVPIIPCYIRDTPLGESLYGTLFVPAHARLTIGRPVDPREYARGRTDRAALEQLTNRILCEIARLAGADDFQPRLAGRRWNVDV